MARQHRTNQRFTDFAQFCVYRQVITGQVAHYITSQYIMWHYITLIHIIMYNIYIISYHIISYHIVLYYIISYHIILYYIIPWSIIIILYYILFYSILFCFIMLLIWYDMIWYDMIWYDMILLAWPSGWWASSGPSLPLPLCRAMRWESRVKLKFIRWLRSWTRWAWKDWKHIIGLEFGSHEVIRLGRTLALNKSEKSW